MTIKSLATAGVLSVGCLSLAGCPTAPGTYALWVVNTSDAFTIQNIRVVDTNDPENVAEYPDDQAPNTTRTVNNLLLEDFEGKTVRVEIDAQAEGQLFDDGEFDVTIPGTIESGTVLVVVVRGDNVLNFGAEYVPVEDASKGRLLVQGLIPPIN